MPSSVRVRVVEARDLPEMDHNYVRSESYTDAYVDVRFRHHENRTQVRANLYPVLVVLAPCNCLLTHCMHLSIFALQIRRKTLNPVWDETFTFDVADDSVLQNEPMEFKVCVCCTENTRMHQQAVCQYCMRYYCAQNECISILCTLPSSASVLADKPQTCYMCFNGADITHVPTVGDGQRRLHK
jgi:C2 domain